MSDSLQTDVGHTYTVEIRFTGDRLDPSDISRRMRLEPVRSLTLTPAPVKARKQRPFWAYNGQGEVGFSSEWRSLEAGFGFLVRRLTPMRSVVLELAQEFEGIWWCGHFQASFDGGPTLSPEALADISSFGLPLFIDNYFSNNP